eukprot:scaffold94986_cov61-Phaeocystis_antarctica.AAC.2
MPSPPMATGAMTGTCVGNKAGWGPASRGRSADWPRLAEAGGRPELDLACRKAGRGVLEGNTALAEAPGRLSSTSRGARCRCRGGSRAARCARRPARPPAPGSPRCRPPPRASCASPSPSCRPCLRARRRHHLRRVHRGAVRHAQPRHELALDLQLLQHGIDLRPATVDDHDPHTERLHERAVRREGLRQLRVGHGVPAVLDHHHLSGPRGHTPQLARKRRQLGTAIRHDAAAALGQREPCGVGASQRSAACGQQRHQGYSHSADARQRWAIGGSTTTRSERKYKWP